MPRRALSGNHLPAPKEHVMHRGWSAVAALIVLATTPLAHAQQPSLFDVDYRAIVSRGDLRYDTPATRSEEGMPVGNGRMGTLTWTTPSALHMQVNRCDVFAEDGTTTSFPKQDTDYASGCGYVDVNVSHAGADVFGGDAQNFKQHLSLYDALMTAQGAGVTLRALAWPQRDVMAIEVDDQRDGAAAEPITIDLRMLRYRIEYITGKNAKLAEEHAVE